MNDYCVILCRRPHVNPDHPRARRFYVAAPIAERAITAALEQNPQFRVVGVEHSDLSPQLLRNYTLWQAA